MSAVVTGTEPYISDDEVVSRMPGMTKGNLAQLRYTGKGPKFYKPSPRIVLYRIGLKITHRLGRDECQTERGSLQNE